MDAKSEETLLRYLTTASRLVVAALCQTQVDGRLLCEQLESLLRTTFGRFIALAIVQYIDPETISGQGYKCLKRLLERSDLIPYFSDVDKQILVLSVQSQLVYFPETESFEGITKTIAALRPLHQESRSARGKAGTNAQFGNDTAYLRLRMFICLLNMAYLPNDCPATPNYRKLRLLEPEAYVVAALKLVSDMTDDIVGGSGRLTTWNFADDSLAHVLLTLPSDLHKLYQLLGLLGRSLDQAKLIVDVVKLSKSIISSGQGFLGICWIQALSELLTLEDIRCAWENLPVKGTLESVFDGTRCKLADAQTTDSFTELHTWSTRAGQFVRKSIALLQATSSDISYEDYSVMLAKVVEDCPSQKTSFIALSCKFVQCPYQTTSFTLSKIWLLLLGSKVLLCSFGYHFEAVAVVWRALSIIGRLPNNPISVNLHSSESILVKVEALIIMGELFEVAGLVDNAASYLSEASAVIKAAESFTALKSIIDFHACRTWFRAGSSRFLLTIMGLAEQDTSKTGLPAYESDQVTKRLRAAAVVLLQLLNVETDETSAPINMSSAANILGYRHIDKHWDTDSLSRRPYLLNNGQPDIHSQALMYQCPRGLTNGAHISQLADKLLARSPITNRLLVSGFALPGAPPYEMALATEVFKVESCLGGIANFDIVRDMRRLGCIHRLGQTCGLTAHQEIFVLGATSIGVSHTMEQKFHDVLHGAGSNVPGHGGVHNAHLNEVSSSKSTLSTLQELGSSAGSIVKCSVLVFAFIEPLNQNLVIGRWETSSKAPLTVHLPVGADLSKLLLLWENLMTRQKEQLRATAAGANVDKWTDSDKKLWWRERMLVDNEIEVLLAKFEGLLGPWRIMFLPVSGSDASEANLTAALEGLQIEELPRSTVKKAKGNPSKTAGAHKRNEMWENLIKISQKNTAFHLSEADLAIICSTLGADVHDMTAGESADSVVGTAAAGTSNPMNLPTAEELALKSMSELKDILKTRGIDYTSRKKSDLIEKVLCAPVSPSSEVELYEGRASALADQEGSTCDLILLLDERLQQIPLESMPCLKRQRCTRVPSLFAFVKMMQTLGITCRKQSPYPNGPGSLQNCNAFEKQPRTSNKLSEPSTRCRLLALPDQPAVQLSKCFYALDPEANLPRTRETMSQFLEPYRERWQWQGAVAKIPDTTSLRLDHRWLLPYLSYVYLCFY
jgi:hypothetical protein